LPTSEAQATALAVVAAKIAMAARAILTLFEFVLIAL
jgi:hypothetical protein